MEAVNLIRVKFKQKVHVRKPQKMMKDVMISMEKLQWLRRSRTHPPRQKSRTTTQWDMLSTDPGAKLVWRVKDVKTNIAKEK